MSVSGLKFIGEEARVRIAPGINMFATPRFGSACDVPVLGAPATFRMLRFELPRHGGISSLSPEVLADPRSGRWRPRRTR